MSLAKLLLTIVNLFSSLATLFREETLRRQGAKQAKAEIQARELEAIEQANQARREARNRINAQPKSNSLPNDGFRRD